MRSGVQVFLLGCAHCKMLLRNTVKSLIKQLDVGVRFGSFLFLNSFCESGMRLFTEKDAWQGIISQLFFFPSTT